jgi:hypothetical protein
MRTLKPILRLTALIALLTLSVAATAKPLRFLVRYAASISKQPYTGRVYIMLGDPKGPEPRTGPNWFQPAPMFAEDVKDWRPGLDLEIDGENIAFPAPLSKLRADRYAIQAVMDLRKDSHEIGNAPGNAYSAVTVARLDPAEGGDISLHIDQKVAPRPFPETDRLKHVDISSPLLTKFYGRPVNMQAAVSLPEGYAAHPDMKYPVVYIVPGFGGDETEAQYLDVAPLAPTGFPIIRVILNPDAPTGHSAFADSANNGPRGEALTTELIPYIESHFRAVGKSYGRFVMGHSSGGWSSLWLQVAYPYFFGGVWSTSPDPVDFRDFQQIDLYKPGLNFFFDPSGNLRPVARDGTTPVLFIKPFVEMETVLGHGGQMGSFNAVFSPKGTDGQPQSMWNPATGAINQQVTPAWRKYDISLILRTNWSTLEPKLRGKLHVWTGGLDTFYLDGAVKLLQQEMTSLHSDADIQILPGKNHFTILTPDLQAQIGNEMMASYRAHAPSVVQ